MGEAAVNTIELHAMKAMHARELKRLESILVACTTCDNWRNGKCSKWDAAPPPEVVQHGCDDWHYDFIPF